MVSGRSPFVNWQIPKPRISEEFAADVDMAVQAYQLFVYLEITQNTYGLGVAERVREYLILFSSFRQGLDLKLRILFKCIEAGLVASASDNSSNSLGNAQVNSQVSLAVCFAYIFDWQRDRAAELLLPFADCLLRGRIWAEKTFQPEMELALPLGSALRWSAVPGPFERQLQRQQDNPLFPPAARTITAHQVTDARVRDLEQIAEFIERYRLFAKRRIDSASDQALDAVLKDIKDATEFCDENSSLDAYFAAEIDAIRKDIESAERHILDATNDNQLRALLNELHALSYISRAVGQVAHGLPNGCDKTDYTIRSMLSEDLETIRNYGIICTVDDGLGKSVRRRAEGIIGEAIRDGMSPDQGRMKLAALTSAPGKIEPQRKSAFWSKLTRIAEGR